MFLLGKGKKISARRRVKILIARRACVQIHINGYDLEPFQHRLPFSLVDHLEVSGDVEIFSVARRRSEVSPANEPRSLALSAGDRDLSQRS